MAIAKTRVHIICGICGCNEMLKYKVVDEPDDKGSIQTVVYLTCDNCNSVTLLSELVKDEVDELIKCWRCNGTGWIPSPKHEGDEEMCPICQKER